jgi:hypothetical protein
MYPRKKTAGYRTMLSGQHDCSWHQKERGLRSSQDRPASKSDNGSAHSERSLPYRHRLQTYFPLCCEVVAQEVYGIANFQN